MVSTNNKIKAGFYLDTENLGGNIPEKQPIIAQALTRWPRILLIESIALYVIEDINLWKSAWEKIVDDLQSSLPGMATMNLPEAVTKPAHHYSRNPNKNAADITIVLDALDDIHQGHTDFAVILSNDSDFAGLLFKLREVQQRDSTGRFSNNIYGNSPFLLITHANSGRSQQLDLLGPNVLKLPVATQQETVASISMAPVATVQSITAESVTVGQVPEAVDNETTPVQMAAEVANTMYKNTFNGIEAFNIIKARWPEHPELNYDVQFDNDRYEISRWFYERIWEPVMQERGVSVDLETRPRLYNMPNEARERLRELDSPN